ncbi:hypothetical protein BJX64DRAFT_291975 [Aspergillus heterothallicus]
MGIGPHQGAVQEVKEAVERAILKVAYAGLERHPDAAPRGPPREKIVTTEIDISRSTICSMMANSHVRISVDDLGQLFVDRGGVAWALKGRGPVYSDDSSVIDCMITAGKLLGAGSTNSDRAKAGWESQLNGLQRAFIELSDANWDLCSPETGAQIKGVLVQLFQQLVPQFGDQTPDAVALLWRMVAEHLNQFTFRSCYVAPQFETADASGIAMQTLLQRAFQARQVSRCGGYNEDGDVLERSFHPLPLRMAIALDPRILILGHTKDVNVTYRASGEVGPNTHATYRWLGGIYHNGQGAYRVFWNDTKRGEGDLGRVCQYNPALDGLIVSEELQGPPPDHRVSPYWWHRKPVPLLFYERVMNPSEELIKAAKNTVKEMLTDYIMGVPTLVSHEPWHTTQHAWPSKSGYPWQPLEVPKPPDAQRFHITDAPYNPAGQTVVASPQNIADLSWTGLTLPPLRSTNLLNASQPQTLSTQSREPSFALPPISPSSYSSTSANKGANRLPSIPGVLNLGLASPATAHGVATVAPTGGHGDADMEMLDAPQPNKGPRSEEDSEL